MTAKDIQNQLDQLAGYLQAGKLEQARVQSRMLFTDLLKTVYAQIRGQVSAVSMRALLDLEIEIGGESGDLKEFDSHQWVDLFMRGDLVSHFEKRVAPELTLATAVNLEAVDRCLSAAGEERGSRHLASLRFVHAWLSLFAQAAGIIDPDEDAEQQTQVLSKTAVKLSDAGNTFTDAVTGMRFVRVPGGVFSMGDRFDEGAQDEQPVHEVQLSPFYMGVYPVTQSQWKGLMGENPSSFTGDDHPVEQVTLPDVIAFIDKLNSASPSHARFDLPTEAQWEFAACSGGKHELYAGGKDPEAVACFASTSTGSTAPVGSKAPNGLGLYDMSGNVWEWCRDVYHAQAYRRHSRKDPICTQGGEDRVIRGGSWHLDAWSARCSRRFRFNPNLFGPALGFRVVMMDQ